MSGDASDAAEHEFSNWDAGDAQMETPLEGSGSAPPAAEVVEGATETDVVVVTGAAEEVVMAVVVVGAAVVGTTVVTGADETEVVVTLIDAVEVTRTEEVLAA